MPYAGPWPVFIFKRVNQTDTRQAIRMLAVTYRFVYVIAYCLINPAMTTIWQRERWTWDQTPYFYLSSIWTIISCHQLIAELGARA